MSATAARQPALVRILGCGLTDSASEIGIAVANDEPSEYTGLVLRSVECDNRAGLIFVDDPAACNFGIERGDTTKDDVLPAESMLSMEVSCTTLTT